MRFSPLRFIFLLIALLTLAGCGKKGALYLPDPAAAPAATQLVQE